MPMHFRRFRILNDTSDSTDIQSAEYSAPVPFVAKVVGPGTSVPVLATQLYIEDEPIATNATDKVRVQIVLAGGAKYDEVLEIGAGVPIVGVDVKVITTGANTSWKGRATLAGANFTFKEVNANFA
ncbi:MAG: hypothetical protein O2894_07970 [Planctomycetota bacterium]|nr:hypothetical protein [Planctomycetota bacterium]